MFEALWLTTFMGFWAVFRRLRQSVMCKSRCSKAIRVFIMADYVVLYVALFGFLWFLLISMYIHLATYGWLNPDTLESRFPRPPGRALAPDGTGLGNVTGPGPTGTTIASVISNSTASTSFTSTTTLTSTRPTPIGTVGSSLGMWDEVMHELSIRPIPFTRGAGILAPWIVLLTWCICAHGTWRHAKEIWQGTGVSNFHDLVIQILALPMVYSLMALSAVLRMWRLMSNSFGEIEGDWHEDWQNSWERTRAKALQIYEADYAVADLYESWALHHFAVLAMALLRQSFDSTSSQLQRSAADLDANSNNMFQAWALTLKGMHKSVSNLAMLGIWSFVISCTCSSFYILGAVMCQNLFGDDSGIGQLIRRNVEKISFFTYGMGCVASSVAICNMIQIERTFHIELLRFGPFLKFWGTKILVSIAFLQTIVFQLPVPPFKDMSTVQMNVTYSTLICYECLLISLLHMYAWSPREPWYADEVENSKSPNGIGVQTPGMLNLSWGGPAGVLGRRHTEEGSGLSEARVDVGFG